MNKQTTQILLVGAAVYLVLQAQKRAKARDVAAPSSESPSGGATSRTGRIVDNAQTLARDAQSFACDNFGLFCA